MSEIPNTRQGQPHTSISNKTIHIHLYQFILYIDLVGLIPLQNMFKMIPQKISIFSKAGIGIFQITIEAVIFNLYQYWQIIIHHVDPLVNF